MDLLEKEEYCVDCIKCSMFVKKDKLTALNKLTICYSFGEARFQLEYFFQDCDQKSQRKVLHNLINLRTVCINTRKEKEKQLSGCVLQYLNHYGKELNLIICLSFISEHGVQLSEMIKSLKKSKGRYCCSNSQDHRFKKPLYNILRGLCAETNIALLDKSIKCLKNFEKTLTHVINRVKDCLTLSHEEECTYLSSQIASAVTHDDLSMDEKTLIDQFAVDFHVKGVPADVGACIAEAYVEAFCSVKENFAL